jgi:hypothetical protein
MNNPRKKYLCAKKDLLTVPLRIEASKMVIRPSVTDILFLGIVNIFE